MLVGPDLRPVVEVDEYLPWLTHNERCPNTVAAYAAGLAGVLAQRRSSPELSQCEFRPPPPRRARRHAVSRHDMRQRMMSCADA